MNCVVRSPFACLERRVSRRYGGESKEKRSLSILTDNTCLRCTAVVLVPVLRRIKTPWSRGDAEPRSHGAFRYAAQLTGTLRRLAFSTLGKLICSTPLSMLAFAPAASTVAGSATVRVKAPRVISLR